ncbi:MAG TPA: fumarylacetoacetate hydrolase family protein [Chloroflexota bacterium]|jgi:2-keto-4-pentenoate hydratase/2-oxohepta-3-ene-1,7-dioic acid hydratase in catechol pathway
MRLVTFDDYRIGVLGDDGVRDVSSVVPGWEPGDLWGMNRLITRWDTLQSRVQEAAASGAAKPLDSVHLLAPIPTPIHLFAAPANYRAHVAEMQQQGFRGTAGGGGGENTADTLGFFVKCTGSISGPQDPIALPQRDWPERRFDHEGEIAFVISRPAKGVSPEDAISYIFGYTIVVDVTLRAGNGRNEERVQRKSYASFSPMGPCVTTADEIGDWRQLQVKLWLNGEQKQDARATDMIVDIPNLLSRASHVLPMSPGDVYTTGSPPGVGRVAPGDTVVVESPGIGRMSLDVIERDW